MITYCSLSGNCGDLQPTMERKSMMSTTPSVTWIHLCTAFSSLHASTTVIQSSYHFTVSLILGWCDQGVYSRVTVSL